MGGSLNRHPEQRNWHRSAHPLWLHLHNIREMGSLVWSGRKQTGPRGLGEERGDGWANGMLSVFIVVLVTWVYSFA